MYYGKFEAQASLLNQVKKRINLAAQASLLNQVQKRINLAEVGQFQIQKFLGLGN
jgi:hypothetical protein